MPLEFVFILFDLTQMLGLLLEDSWELLSLKILTIARDLHLLLLGLPLWLLLLDLRDILATGWSTLSLGSFSSATS